MRKNPVQITLAVILWLPLALGVAAQLGAQQAPAPAKPAGEPAPSAKPLAIPVGTQFMRDRSFFPVSVSPYLPWQIPKPVMVNSPTLEQMIHNGKLELSLGDAIRLAIENNLQIDMQRYTTWIADTSVLAARGGANAAGAPLDPRVTSTLYWQQASQQNYNPFLSGTGTSTASATTSKNELANFGYHQGFLSGTSFDLEFNNQRYASSSPGNFINPILSGTLGFTITQPLLSGFGFLPNEYNIIEAKNGSQIARYELENQATLVISNVENAYWTLAADIASVQASQANVDAAQKNLKDTQEKVAIGTAARFEVVTAESSVKDYQQQLIGAQAAEREDEVTLLNLIVRNQTAAGLENITIVPTDNINTPPKIDIVPYRQALDDALRQRPDFLEQELMLRNNGISVRANRNLLLPSLSLQAGYQSTGLAGPSTFVTETPTGIAANTNAPIVDANGNPVLINGQPVYSSAPTFSTKVEQVQAGLLDSWNTLWHLNYPVYTLSLNLGLPLHNRVAQAAEANALLTERKQEEQVQYWENQIAAQVRQAQIAVSTGMGNVQAAAEHTQLAKQTLANAQERYKLGQSSQFEITQDQANVAAAQSIEIQVKAALLRAVVSLNEALGRTLQDRNISISDASKGRVYRAPLIPGTPIRPISPSSFPRGGR